MWLSRLLSNCLNLKHKKNTIVLSIVSSVFFIAPAFASTQFGQTAYSSDYITKKSYDAVLTTTTLSHFYQILTAPVSGNLEQITFKATSHRATTANCSLTISGTGTPGSLVTSTTLAPGVITTQTMYFTDTVWFGSPYTITQGGSIVLQFSCSNGTAIYDIDWYGTNNVLATAATFGYSASGSPTSTDSTYNGSFQQSYYIITVSSNVSTIQFETTPASTCSFSNFSANLYPTSVDEQACADSGTCTIGVALNSGMASTTFVYPYIIGSVQTASLLNPVQISNGFTMVSGTVYNARAFYCSQNDQTDCTVYSGNPNLLAYSSNWQFVVNGLDTCTTTYYNQGTIPFPVYATSSPVDYTAMINTNCDAYRDGSMLGSVQYGFCKILSTLFLPNQNSMEQFTGIQNLVATKPPFGYVTVYGTFVSSTINGVPTASSTIASSSFAYTDISTPFQNNFLVQALQQGITILLYAAVPFYIFFRLKNFSLHG